MKKYIATIWSVNNLHGWQPIEADTLRQAKVKATLLLEPSAYVGDTLRLVEVDEKEKRPLRDLPYWEKPVLPGKQKWIYIN